MHIFIGLKMEKIIDNHLKKCDTFQRWKRVSKKYGHLTPPKGCYHPIWENLCETNFYIKYQDKEQRNLEVKLLTGI